MEKETNQPNTRIGGDMKIMFIVYILVFGNSFSPSHMGYGYYDEYSSQNINDIAVKVFQIKQQRENCPMKLFKITLYSEDEFKGEGLNSYMQTKHNQEITELDIPILVLK